MHWLIFALTQLSANGVTGTTGTQKRSLSELVESRVDTRRGKHKKIAALSIDANWEIWRNHKTGDMDTKRATANIRKVKLAIAVSAVRRSPCG